MSRYIDADKINAKLMDEYHGMISDESMKIYKIMQMLDNAPTADVQEVRHAQWWDATPPRFYACSYCGGAGHSIYKFCPWCGAKMDG